MFASVVILVVLALIAAVVIRARFERDLAIRPVY
jgi:hypothetical protein